MAFDRDAALAPVQRRQHSVASYPQLQHVGFDRHTIQRRIDAGIWELAQPNVIRDAGAPITWESRVMAGCLSTDGVASHVTAAVLHGLDGVRRTPKPDITIARSQESSGPCSTWRRWPARRSCKSPPTPPCG